MKPPTGRPPPCIPGIRCRDFCPPAPAALSARRRRAARIHQLNEDKTANALGNAGYLAPISMAEQLMGGFTIKIVQGGQAASAGIMAAGLAGCGLTGAPGCLKDRT